MIDRIRNCIRKSTKQCWIRVIKCWHPDILTYDTKDTTTTTIGRLVSSLVVWSDLVWSGLVLIVLFPHLSSPLSLETWQADCSEVRESRCLLISGRQPASVSTLDTREHKQHNMSFKDFIQNMKMWGAYVRIKTLFKWTFVISLLTCYFIYVITKLVYIWIPLIWTNYDIVILYFVRIPLLR